MLDTVAIERLQTLQFIGEKKNLLISGKSGAGKTYLASALCVEACHQFYTVKYTRANRLNLEFEAARANDTYKDQMDKLVSYDLLVIDDFGLIDYSGSPEPVNPLFRATCSDWQSRSE